MARFQVSHGRRNDSSNPLSDSGVQSGQKRQREPPNDLAQPFRRRDANTSQERIHEGEILMEVARRRRHWRISKSKHKRQRSSKPSALWRRRMSDDSGSTEAEGIDRLLLSALRYWEVERDLIEERMAARGW
jgi:hypothetical protein